MGHKILAFVLFSFFPLYASALSKADYHDVDEMEAVIDAFDGYAGGLISVHRIGTTPGGRDIRAVLLSENRSSGNDTAGNADRPALLIECGTHSREWAAPEMCMMFIQGFALGYIFDNSRINDIVQNADIWVIPMVNPDGRDLDDTAGGDPEQFWTDTFWHPSNTSDSNGWRASAQLITCAPGFFGVGFGIDLNRAYSQGWSSGNSDCQNNQYHGEFPFQAVEAQHLRKFVNNRMISMSLSVHSNGPCIAAQNGDGDVPLNFQGIFNDELNPAATELMLNSGGGCPTGRGVGQFTGWMAKPSDTSFEKDHSTNRAAVSLLLELPPDGTAYNSVLNPSPYRFSVTDASNPFHPSASSFISETFDGFYNATMYLAEQARSPWCAIDPLTLQMSSSCTFDFGLTGAKIASCRNCVGLLRKDVRANEVVETMSAGTRKVIYRVQNFDATTPVNQTVRVNTVISSRIAWPNPYTTDLVESRTYDLAAGEGEVDSVPFAFVPGREYMVSIDASPVSYVGDSNGDNNSQLFRFEVP